MDTAAFSALAMACAPLVHASTAYALVAVESAFNPHAIGVVHGSLAHQPRSHAEALATANNLQARGWNFSVGLAQINRNNFDRLGLTEATALEPCTNLRAMQAVLIECFDRWASKSAPQAALRRALSCYYSGNPVTGIRHGYVNRVARALPSARQRGSAPP